MLVRMLGFLAGRRAAGQLRQFQKKLHHCRNVQNELLKQILNENKLSDFGRRHNFGKIGGYGDFTAVVPPANYEYFRPYIENCMAGHKDALLGQTQKLLMFAMTSGTTAAAKYIPVTEASLAAYRRGWMVWGGAAFADHPEAKLRKILQISSPAAESTSEAGLPCGSISGVLAENQHPLVKKFYAIPQQIAAIENPADRYYTIMRCAIVQDLGMISTANPSTTLMLARVADDNSLRIIRDIYNGTVDTIGAMPRAGADALKKILRPDRRKAEQLESLLDTHGRLLPQHYWNLSFLANWTGGTLGLYLPKLAEYYGAIPIRDIGLLASEGRVSIPLEDASPAGVLDITGMFFEFAPQEEYERIENHGAETLQGTLTLMQACQLEKSRCYYVFLTNQAGLYRYNLGDLVRVIGHVGTTPIVEFLSKGNHISSITGEKLTEHQLVEAVRSAADGLAIAVENFVAVPQFSQPPCYRLYFESAEPLPNKQLAALANLIDQRLTLANIEYDSKRDSGRLGGVEVRQLPLRFLAKRDERLVKENAGRTEQFKHRFLYNTPLDIE